MKPKFITFTGFDDRTDIGSLKKLSDEFPIELGILFSPSNRDARFPSMQAVEELFQWGIPLSAHLCGGFASKAWKRGAPELRLPLNYFKRIQINGRIEGGHGIKVLQEQGFDVITQCRQFKPNSLTLQLFDTSGGRGESPDDFPSYPNTFCGYAGGIGPDNVIDVLQKIDAPNDPTSNGYWIDMEGNIRTDGWFDVTKLRSVCEQVYER